MGLPSLPEEEQLKLDEKLLWLLDKLRGRPPMPFSALLAKAGRLFESYTKKLIQAGWEALWEHRPGRLASGRFYEIGGGNDCHGEELHDVFVSLGYVLKNATTPDLQKEFRAQLEAALEKYLRWRGYTLPAGLPAPQWFADFPKKEQQLLAALDGKGKVPIEAVQKAVYGPNPNRREGTLKRLVTRTNRRLAEKGIGFHIKESKRTWELVPILD